MKTYQDYPLSQTLWYQLGGKAKYFLQCQNQEDIQEAFDTIEKRHVKQVFTCGIGSNLIFTDDYFDGAVIQIATHSYSPTTLNPSASFYNSLQTTEKYKKPIATIDGDIVEVFAGSLLNDVITQTLAANLTGLEWAGGLPGTVGAGVRGNVGAFGGDIKDSLFSVTVLERQAKGTGNINEIKKEDLHFGYRDSLVKENKNLVVISAKFQLHAASSQALEKAKDTYRNNIAYRKLKHPVAYASCGSVFKNISKKNEVEKIVSIWPDVTEFVEKRWHGKVSMGYINNRLGFAGYRLGNAQVSEKHNNFIVNLGDAKAKDVLGIIKDIQDKVSQTFGFLPEVEAEIVK